MRYNQPDGPQPLCHIIVSERAEIDKTNGRLPGQQMVVDVRRDVRDSPAVPGSAITRFHDNSRVTVPEARDGGATVRQHTVKPGLSGAYATLGRFTATPNWMSKQLEAQAREAGGDASVAGKWARRKGMLCAIPLSSPRAYA